MSFSTVDKARAWDAASESYDKGFLRGMEFAAKVVEIFLLDGTGKDEDFLDGAAFGRRASAEAIRSAISMRDRSARSE